MSLSIVLPYQKFWQQHQMIWANELYLIQTEQNVSAMPRVQVGANWGEAHCRLILDGFKIKLCSSSKISPRGKKPTRHVECWASSTENFQLEIRKMWLWQSWLWVVVRTSSIRVTIVEVGGKRTIKYQNTSYGIDMQMLRLLLLPMLTVTRFLGWDWGVCLNSVIP